MDEALRCRAELAVLLLAPLATLSPAQWRDCVVARGSDPHCHAFALELADEATCLLGEHGRDAPRFNAGAFGELMRPFRAPLDVNEVERLASRVRPPPHGRVPIDFGAR